MNIFKRSIRNIRNAYWDFKIGCRYPGIQEAVDRTNNEAAQERLKALIADRKARKLKHSHFTAQLAALKTEALERGW